ncbi:hypothetical protein KIN20_038010 [Parelaphostrongylus tenuis]|uniref:Uncharacterized protein n=1 Tax=Parelaphostrongylus tenuis TaxID=148309 RepID=A0AAD5WLC9_PARTN|nr:hypothetical protein KIN20_038010 [Parelaphostrongylus tenuis]
MSSGGGVGRAAAGLSREDLPSSRSRNNSVRRTAFAPSEALLGVPNTSAFHGGRGRRRFVCRYDSPVHPSAVVPSQICGVNQNQQSHNYRRQNFSNNSRETGRRGRGGRRIRHRSEINIVTEIEEADPPEDSVPCYPGFVFDPVTRKHFRIAPDYSGINNFTQRDLVRAKREKERCNQLARDRSAGIRSFNEVVRNVYESRLLRVGYIPNAIQETYLDSSGEHVKGCQFLEFVGNNDDEKMLGCWAIGDGSRNSRIASKLACLKAKFDDVAAEKAAVKLDQICRRDKCSPGSPSLNTLGLEFVLDGEPVDISQPVLVDMTVAPVDSDVTCVLYVTAESRMTGIGISSMCKVVLHPLPALCLDDDDFEVRDSPIYNIQWSVESSAIYSCAWNSNKTRIALGMEEAAKIVDVITEKSFMISSRRRNVISQHFSSDGNVIFMGLRDSDVILSDLRMKSHHVIGTLKGSRSTGWIKQLRIAYPQCVMIENFKGELKMYDSRQMDRELMSYDGHCNTHFRLPCTVDSQENFVFAVGSDGCTRGWSLSSGQQLCAVPCPRPVDDRTDFPRVAYSSSWGGRAGSSALVLAVGDSLRIHHLAI